MDGSGENMEKLEPLPTPAPTMVYLHEEVLLACVLHSAIKK